MTVLTISRQMGSLGDEIAEALSSRLGWQLITRARLIERFFADAGPHEHRMLNESARFYQNIYHDNVTYLDHIRRSLSDLAKAEPAILVGFGSQLIFAGDRGAIHIRIIAPESVRVSRVRRQFQLSEQKAQELVQSADKKHKRFVATLYEADLTDPTLYDLTLNTGSLTVEECLDAVVAVVREREACLEMECRTAGTEVVINPSERGFKNPAETEFARILDMYQIEWKYEPKTFPIEWDPEGNVTLAFSPDFYLPLFDTYIELTTMNQRYVTLKNRKVKKLRELYPGINIRIVYKKDFQSLIERFNAVPVSTGPV